MLAPVDKVGRRIPPRRQGRIILHSNLKDGVGQPYVPAVHTAVPEGAVKRAIQDTIYGFRLGAGILVLRQHHNQALANMNHDECAT